MNNRDYKNFAKDGIYHIYNRGNNKMPIFRDNQDYFNFIKRLALALGMSKTPFDSKRIRIQEYGSKCFSLLAYSLMPNHFHLLIQQNSSVPISTLMSSVLTSYSKYFNKKYNHTGNVFQDHIKSVLITSNSQLLWLICYIHLNAVLSKIVKKPEEYSWSSYREYLGINTVNICDTSIILKQFKSLKAFEKITMETFIKLKSNKMSKGVFDI